MKPPTRTLAQQVATLERLVEILGVQKARAQREYDEAVWALAIAINEAGDELDRLQAEFDASGGRGVDLADAIDTLNLVLDR